MTLESQILKELALHRQMLEQLLSTKGGAWVRIGQARQLMGVGRSTFNERFRKIIRRKKVGAQWRYSRADINKLVNQAKTEIGGKVIPFDQPPQPMRRHAS